MSDRRGAARRRLEAALTVAALAVLPACELMLAEPAPEPRQACGSWRGGCPAGVDFATDAPTPTLRAEDRLDANVAFADGGPRLECRTAPWICQLEMGAEVFERQYLDPVR